MVHVSRSCSDLHALQLTNSIVEATQLFKSVQDQNNNQRSDISAQLVTYLPQHRLTQFTTHPHPPFLSSSPAHPTGLVSKTVSLPMLAIVVPEASFTTNRNIYAVPGSKSFRCHSYVLLKWRSTHEGMSYGAWCIRIKGIWYLFASFKYGVVTSLTIPRLSHVTWTIFACRIYCSCLLLLDASPGTRSTKDVWSPRTNSGAGMDSSLLIISDYLASFLSPLSVRDRRITLL